MELAAVDCICERFIKVKYVKYSSFPIYTRIHILTFLLFSS